MNIMIHKSESRGHANHGWLDTFHTFSFGMYHEPSRIHFGMLRVLNDDFVIGGAGFGKHNHDNMEIISIPLQGSLAHSDSTGNEGVISTGDVQIMSAGSGIQHAEYNASETELVNFLQLWIIPKEKKFNHDMINCHLRKSNFGINYDLSYRPLKKKALCGSIKMRNCISVSLMHRLKYRMTSSQPIMAYIYLLLKVH